TLTPRPWPRGSATDRNHLPGAPVMTDTLTLSQITDDAVREFDAWIESQGAISNADAYEKIAEISGDAAPAVTAALLQLALEDLWLAAAEPDDAPHANTAVACIQTNINE